MEEVEAKENPDESCEPTSSALLVLSSVTFLVFSALVHSMTKSKRETIMKQWGLISVRFVAAMLCAVLYFLPARAACAGEYPVATFVVPLLFFFSACIEVYGLQEKGYSLVKRYKHQSTVQRMKPLQKGGSSKTLNLNFDPSMDDKEMV